jgi:uncharacterized membrane protein
MKSTNDIFPVNVGKKERIVSEAIGAGLIVVGLFNVKHPGIKTFFELGAGALMLFRGATGYCPVNAAVGRNTAGIDEVGETNFESLAE